jgi:putative chitinase
MAIDRKKFFDSVRENLFNGVLTQRQVDGMNYLLDVWEEYHFDKDIRWLAYALATTFHETAFLMSPIEEYGKGSGKPYGEPVPPHGNSYYGRGYVQLTWLENYQKAEEILREKYDVEAPLVEYPHRMLEHEPSALVLYDGSIEGWFTGVGLPTYFNETTDDPYNARRVINGTDKADIIAGYHRKFLDALT